MTTAIRLIPLAAVLFALPCPAPACSLCGPGFRNQSTLRSEIAAARVVLVGAVTDGRLAPAPGRPGEGSSDLRIARILKDDPLLADKKQAVISRYLPVLDPKAPPQFVVFGREQNGKLDLYHGREVKSEAVVAYLEGAGRLQGQDQVKALLYFFNFLDHADGTIAADAFLEFARSNDKDIGEVARQLPAARLRQLLENPQTPPERLGLFAFLLSAAGTDRDADLLKSMIERPNERTINALEGLLSGYINLRPRAGWDLTRSLLADGKKQFNQRFPAICAVRFHHAWKPTESRAEILRCLEVMIPDGEIADFAIDDLRKWQTWDLTPLVLAQYGKKTHDAPIVRRTIVRYALCCPRPEARQFITELRRRDADLVRELEEALEFDKEK